MNGRRMDFDTSLIYMQGLVRFGWKLGNERFSALCDAFSNPQDRYPIVHVAGTKGKGSTTALTAAILAESGLLVGSYYSPYVYDVRERVQVTGELISRAEFAEIVSVARPVIEKIAATDLGQITEFELKTFVGFEHFKRKMVNVACIEVGIGGRLDATNIVNPCVTVITNIGLDHTQILGDTHELIASEKAGIIKPGIRCITAAAHLGALSVISQIANDRNAPISRVEIGRRNTVTEGDNSVICDLHPDGNADIHSGPFRVCTASAVYNIPAMAMQGSYQRLNAACAIAAAEDTLRKISVPMRLNDNVVRRALAKTTLPGRLTVYKTLDNRIIVQDGAHNAMAAEALSGALDNLRQKYDIHRTIAVIGMLEGHDPRPVAASLLSSATRVIACNPGWKRALPATELADKIADLVSAPEVEVIPDVRTAVEAALRYSEAGDMILITGSFYTVGEVRPEWLRERIELGD